jgi:hypothetical protein
VLDDCLGQILLSPAEALAAALEWERQGALLALAMRRIEVSCAYESGGAASMKDWLRDQARMSDRRITELLATGRFLDNYCEFAQAAVSGVLSGSQIDVARRLNRPKYANELTNQQAELVGLLASSDITATVALVDHWRNCADAVIDDKAPPVEPPCELLFARTMDERMHGSFSLDDAAATEFEKAVQNALTWDGNDETRTITERQGDALYDIAAFFNSNHTGNGTPRHLPTVTLSADLSTITSEVPEGVNDDTGRPMSPACTATYLCDCQLHVILRDANGTPERFGRMIYTVPRTLFRQVAARDGGCRFPGCNRPVRYTDAHHIHHWQHGGPTDYDNLLLLCRRHHTYVHRQRVTIKLEPDGHAHFTWHDGQERTSQPRGAPPTRRQA